MKKRMLESILRMLKVVIRHSYESASAYGIYQTKEPGEISRFIQEMDKTDLV